MAMNGSLTRTLLGYEKNAGANFYETAVKQVTETPDIPSPKRSHSPRDPAEINRQLCSAHDHVQF